MKLNTRLCIIALFMIDVMLWAMWWLIVQPAPREVMRIGTGNW